MPRYAPVHYLLLLALGTSLTSCFRMKSKDKKLLRKFAKVQTSASIHYYTYKDYEIRYAKVNGEKKDLPTVIFIHGAPGQLSEYIKIMGRPELQNAARIIAVDRPGYGRSNYGKALTSIEEQARALDSLILRYQNDAPLVVVGHSFGGPIAAQVAVHHPNAIDHVIMLAPAISPEDEKIFWIAHLGKIPPFRWLLSPALRVATDEKFSHVEELEKLKPQLSQINTRVTYVHGTKDFIVPYRNIHFAREQLSQADTTFITLPKANHILQHSHRDFIVEQVLKAVSDQEMGK